MVVRSSLAFYNRLFLVPKPNKKWRPILDLSQLNVFLNTGTFKMEILETIRLSLKTGEWITSLDFTTRTFTFQLPKGQGNISGSSYSTKSFSSQLSPSVWPQLHWSLPRWSSEGYQDPPVPRRLVTESPFPGNLPTIYPDHLGPLPTVRMGSKYDQIRASSQTGLQFCRLPV